MTRQRPAASASSVGFVPTLAGYVPGALSCRLTPSAYRRALAGESAIASQPTSCGAKWRPGSGFDLCVTISQNRMPLGFRSWPSHVLAAVAIPNPCARRQRCTFAKSTCEPSLPHAAPAASRAPAATSTAHARSVTAPSCSAFVPSPSAHDRSHTNRCTSSIREQLTRRSAFQHRWRTPLAMTLCTDAAVCTPTEGANR